MFKYDIKKRRLELGLTLEEVGKAVGVSKSTVRKWETGYIGNMKRDKIGKLATVLKISPAEFMGWDISKLETYPVGTIHKIPIIGRVAAGSGCLAQYDPLGYEIATDIKNPEEYIYFKVKGDSMHPNIMDGDLALIHIQPDVESGELAVVVVNCEEGVIKKVVKHDGAVSLVSFNPEYPPRLIMGYELKEFYIFGKVVETKRKY